jgi:hypothetical protein
MTEEEWLACVTPEPMRQFITLSKDISQRKHFLWSVACFRLTEGDAARGKVEMLEKYAERQVGWRKVQDRGVLAWWVTRFPMLLGQHFASQHAWFVAALRDIAGNPFRPVSLDSAWRTPTVSSLAQAAYENRSLPSGHLDNARLMILADAVEEADCTDAAVLDHLRSPGPHVRGCWVVDLLTGRE